MHVRRVTMKRFIRHENSTYTFPATGIVTITGPNEVGKSSIIEGIACGLWGKTICGADPWAASKGSVEVETDRVVVRREYKGGRTRLYWRLLTEEKFRDYATMTKAQEDLESVVGPFALWRKTSVYSSADAAQFSTASDAERKRLLETLLGLDVFDAALAACRSDLRSVGDARGTLVLRREVLAERIAGYERALADSGLVAPGDEKVDPAALRVEARELSRLIAEGETMLRDLRGSSAKDAERAVRADSECGAVAAKLSALSGDRCPTCDQPIPKEMRAALQGEVLRARQEADALRDRARTLMEEGSTQADEIGEEQQELVQRRAMLLTRASTAERDAERCAEAAKAAARAGRDLEAARVELKDLEERFAALTRELDEVHAAENVLGLRGVRAHLLGRTLKGIEGAANVHLGRIARSDLRITLRPFTEKRTGGVSDAIAMDVKDGRVSRPYRAFSGGARRRLDVSLLLALSEVSAAAHGVDPGTIAFDEPFDALDADGIRAVSEVVRRMAERRLVVVVTHRPELVADLQADLRIALAVG